VPTIAGSEVLRGERRVVAKKLKAGDQVLRSVEDGKVPSFTVARARITDHYTGGATVEAVSDTGDTHLFWPTDVLMVATGRE
jgi:hypothetical protein